MNESISFPLFAINLHFILLVFSKAKDSTPYEPSDQNLIYSSRVPSNPSSFLPPVPITMNILPFLVSYLPSASSITIGSVE